MTESKTPVRRYVVLRHEGVSVDASLDGTFTEDERDRRGTQHRGRLPTRYLEAGAGEPLVLLHALGESAKPVADYSPAFFERFAAGFLDALGLQRAAVVGNSLGGLTALRLALSEPSRVGALILVGSAGLGRSATFALRSLSAPGYGELSIAWARTPRGGPGRRRSCSSRIRNSLRPRGRRSSTGWPNCQVSWKRRWPRCEASSICTVSAMYCWIGFPT